IIIINSLVTPSFYISIYDLYGVNNKNYHINHQTQFFGFSSQNHSIITGGINIVSKWQKLDSRSPGITQKVSSSPYTLIKIFKSRVDFCFKYQFLYVSSILLPVVYKTQYMLSLYVFIPLILILD
ncbi:hypothetical protein M8C21_032515, partial [Ambrosia artemisiifolia]